MATSDTSFKKGENGNGRGKSFKNKLLETIKENAMLGMSTACSPQKAEKAYLKHFAERAFDKDDRDSATLLKELVSKSYPAMKAVMPEFEFDYEVSESPTEQVNHIIMAASKGQIPPDVAGIFLQSIRAAADIEAHTEIKDRLEKLEAMINGE